jgi:hypothetical protein
MAKTISIKTVIKTAIDNGTARVLDGGKAVLHENILYTVRADGYRRMPAQKENRRRLGIILPTVVMVPTKAQPVATITSRPIAGPAAVSYGKRAQTADYTRAVRRMIAEGKIPQPTKVA